MVLLYGERWRTAGALLQLLSPYVLMTTVLGNMIKFLVAQAKLGRVMKMRVIYGVVLVLGLLILLDKYGIWGAALAVDVAYLIGLGLAYISVGSSMKSAFKRFWAPPILSCLFALSCFYGLRIWMLQIRVVENLVNLAIVPSFACYVGGLWLLEKKQMKRDISYLLNMSINWWRQAKSKLRSRLWVGR